MQRFLHLRLDFCNKLKLAGLNPTYYMLGMLVSIDHKMHNIVEGWFFHWLSSNCEHYLGCAKSDTTGLYTITSFLPPVLLKFPVAA